MRKLNFIKLGTVTIASLALSIGFLANLTLAANPMIFGVTFTPVPFYSNVPGQSSQMAIGYDLNTGGYPTAPVIEQIQDTNGDVVYEFGAAGADNKATGHISLQWDGKCNVVYSTGLPCVNGNYVPNGQYKLFINATTASPPAYNYNSPFFTVAQTVVPKLAVNPLPATSFYTLPAINTFPVHYTLTRGNDVPVTVVRLTISGPSGAQVDTVLTDMKVADGSFVLTWDGKNNGVTAPAGTYTWALTATSSVNGFSVDATPISGNFTVYNSVKSDPTISSLSVDSNPYNPDKGLLKLSYTLNNTSGTANVTHSILKGTTTIFTATGVASNGLISFHWDGKDLSNQTVSDGQYTFKVSGTDGQISMPEQTLDFTVTKTVVPDQNPNPTKCAGFTDVLLADANCNAITFAQSLGAMTGNPDGSFAPNAILQRDQVAKIILETFKKFDKQTDYCAGVNPFGDVIMSNWAYQYICRGKALGMITGYQSGADLGMYRPARSVNRVEFLALLLRNLNDSMPTNDIPSYNDIPTGQWFSGYARYSQIYGLFVGNNLMPTNYVSRVEVAKVIYQLHQNGKI